MQRVVLRRLPDGIERKVMPFHISMEGLEMTVLFRDDEDYSVMVKYIVICAKRKNVIVVIHNVVSNHAHIAVLAATQYDAEAFAVELKKVYAMWFSRKYGEKNILHRVDVKAILLDTDRYVRCALSYIVRNSLDNGVAVHEYPWSGYRAMFRTCPETQFKKVCLMTKREREKIMHTGDDLRDVPWAVDASGNLIPDSFCDVEYLEQVFNGDQSYFLRTIGDVDPAWMKEILIDSPRKQLPDSDFFREVESVAERWFSQGIADLVREKKFRLMSYIWHTRKTTVNQLARVFGLPRETVREAVRRKG